jgi:TRAP-type C4-dicarboxylate transport system substrate-binding protein
MRRRSVLLAGALAAPFLACRAKASPKTLELHCIVDFSRAKQALRSFAAKLGERSSGALEVDVEVVMPVIPLPIMSKTSAFSFYYPPVYAETEALFGLCSVPMLVGSLAEAEMLLRVARPYYGAALARHGQILLAAQPSRPAALWSTFRIRDARDLKGASFGQPSLLHDWSGPFARLGARLTSYMEAEVTLNYGTNSIRGFYGSSYGDSTSLELSGQFGFMAEIFFAVQLSFLTASRETFESLSEPERQAVLMAGRELESELWAYMRDFMPVDHRDIAARGVVVDTRPSGLIADLGVAAEADIQRWARQAGSEGTALLTEYRQAVGRG